MKKAQTQHTSAISLASESNPKCSNCSSCKTGLAAALVACLVLIWSLNPTLFSILSVSATEQAVSAEELNNQNTEQAANNNAAQPAQTESNKQADTSEITTTTDTNHQATDANASTTSGASAESGSTSASTTTTSAVTSISTVKPVVNRSKQAMPQEVILPNGLRVLLLEDHSFPVISCLVWYRVGSRNETPGMTGLSHLVEHLLFQNIGSFRKNELGASIVANGGQFNGFTSEDFTAFYSTIAPSKLELVLHGEADRMRSAKFTRTDVQSEIANLVREFDQENKDPVAVLNRQVHAIAFQQHPYRNPPGGWQHDIEHLTYEDAKYFYDRFFYPDNASLVLVGDFKNQNVVPLVKKYFLGLAKAPAAIPAMRVSEQMQPFERRVIIKSPNKKEAVILAYAAPAISASDAPAMIVLEKLLNGQISGRLKKQLVETKVCSSAQSVLEVKRDPGLFLITLTAASGIPLSKVMDSSETLINTLRSQLVGDTELNRAKKQAEFEFFNEGDGPYHAGFHLGYFETLTNWQSTFNWPDKIHSVTASDIERVAKQYLSPDTRVIGQVVSTNSQINSSAKTIPTTPIVPGKSILGRMLSRKAPATAFVSPENFSNLPNASDKDFIHLRFAAYKQDDQAVTPDSSITKKKVSKISSDPITVKKTDTQKSGIQKVDVQKSDTQKIDTSEMKKSSTVSAVPTARAKKNAEVGTSTASKVTNIKTIDKATVEKKTDKKTSEVKTGESKESKASEIKAPIASKVARPAAVRAQTNTSLQTHAEPHGTINNNGSTAAADTRPTSGNAGVVSYQTLPNGLQVLVITSHLCPIVQIRGSIQAGGIYEPADKKGLSALTGMALNYSNARTNHSQLIAEQEDIGLPPRAMLNFESNTEIIKFKTRCLSDDFRAQFTRLSNCLKDPHFQDADIEKVKSDLLSNISQNENSVTPKVERALIRSVVPENSPYYPVDPSERAKSITALKQGDLKDFYNDRIAPNSTAIVIAGDIEPKEAFALAERLLGSWSKKDISAKPSINVLDRHGFKSSLPIKENGQSMVCLGRMINAKPDDADDKAWTELLIADCALTNHPFFSRIHQRFESEPELAASFHADALKAHLQPFSSAVLWSLYLPLDSKSSSNSIVTIQNELKHYGKTGLNPAELIEAKRYLLGSLPVNRMANLDAISKYHLEALSEQREFNPYAQAAAAIRLASLESVNKFILNDFKPDQAALIVAGNRQLIKQLHPSHSESAESQ